MTTSRWEWNDKVKGYTRPDTLDEYVFKEIKPSYNCLELGEGDIVLDIGANIGAFSKYAMEKGAYVYAYEPEPENYELLVVNTHPDSLSTRGGWIKRMQSAVVGTDETEIELYINSKKNKGLHMTRPVRGREGVTVRAENFSRIIDEIEPNKVKIDVEGGEYGFMPIEFPDCVEKLVMELHFQYNKEWRGMAVGMHKNMLGQGFSVIKEPKLTGGNWTTVAGYSR
tara:strand:+ start:35 stop:709 length:675 start_codon:yes stop_codon:yes gene_type:complete